MRLFLTHYIIISFKILHKINRCYNFFWVSKEIGNWSIFHAKKITLSFNHVKWKLVVNKLLFAVVKIFFMRFVQFLLYLYQRWFKYRLPCTIVSILYKYAINRVGYIHKGRNQTQREGVGHDVIKILNSSAIMQFNVNWTAD